MIYSVIQFVSKISLALFLQVQDVPKPSDSEPLRLDDPFDIIFYVVIPILILGGYFFYRRRRKRIEKKIEEDRRKEEKKNKEK